MKVNKTGNQNDRTLAQITQLLYAYNLTLDLDTGEYSLIIGTGLERLVDIYKKHTDYTAAQKEAGKYLHPAYEGWVDSILDIDNLRNCAQQSGHIDTVEYPVLYLDSESYEWHEVNVFASSDNEGKPIINILGRDVTEAHDRADTKAQLEIAEAASKSKTQFLFNMSHDIRTPMNAIIGFTNLLEKHLDDQELAKNYIDKIKYSNEFLLSLINNVLEMARIESGKETLDISKGSVYEFNDSLEAIFTPQMEEKGLHFSINTHVEHFMVFADKTKSKEIFLNILSNALKYTPSGGSVAFDTYEISSDREGISLYKTVISDTGIGMAKEFLPHLFDEFARGDQLYR